MSLTRRTFLEGASAAAVAGLMPGAQAAPAPAPRRRASQPPNIIFMLADDHRWDALGCMGNPIVHTPNLDQLGHDGVIFDQHFTTTPICCASRASYMTGQYAATNGIYDFATPLSSAQLADAYWTQLKQAGYRVGFIGKFGVGNTLPSASFDYWKGFPGQGNYFPQGPQGPHLAHIIRDQAREFIAGASTDPRPFCLSISFKAPHVQDQSPEQYLPAPEMLSLYQHVTIPPISRAPASDIVRLPLSLQHSESRHRWGVRFATEALYQASVKGYYRLISGNDATVGALRTALREQGLEQNTVIIYSADHGICNGEHGLAGKWYPYEEDIRIPLLIYDPRQPASTRGQRRSATTLNIDLHPTLLDLVGLPAPATVQGQSLLRLLQQEERDFRSVFFIEHHFPDNGWIPSSEAIRTARWKYIRWTGDTTPATAFPAPYTARTAPHEELYDLSADPYETHDLIHQAQVARQQRALSGYLQAWRASLRTPAAKTGRWSPPVTSADLRRDGVLA